MTIPICESCGKPNPICMCDVISPISGRTKLLILQHPQEKVEILSTAQITAKSYSPSILRTGLSWPNLRKAYGSETNPKNWVSLYLGSSTSTSSNKAPPTSPVIAVDKKGRPLESNKLVPSTIEGLIVLDGTWSQAKTLWWRNAWLLKTQRAIIVPRQPSLYGRLRREPRREAVSTLEAAAYALGYLEGNLHVEESLLKIMKVLMQRVRQPNCDATPETI